MTTLKTITNRMNEIYSIVQMMHTNSLMTSDALI